MKVYYLLGRMTRTDFMQIVRPGEPEDYEAMVQEAARLMSEYAEASGCSVIAQEAYFHSAKLLYMRREKDGQLTVEGLKVVLRDKTGADVVLIDTTKKEDTNA
jgi:hypothetical protein